MTYIERHMKRLIVDVLEIDKSKGVAVKVSFGLTEEHWNQLGEYMEMPLDDGGLVMICVNIDKDAEIMFVSLWSFGQEVYSREIGVKANRNIAKEM